MKILVLYGDNEIALDNRLKILIGKAKINGFEIYEIDCAQGEGLNNLNYSRGLFGAGLYIFHNFTKLSEKEILKISKNIPGDIVFIQKGALPKGYFDKLAKDTTFELYKMPKLIYKFLDSFYPNNAKYCLSYLHRLDSKEPDELILHLLAKHLHDLLIVKLDPVGLDYPDWRIIKLTEQSKKFSEKKLISLIKQLSKIDLIVKSSKTKLLSSLDLLIASELE